MRRVKRFSPLIYFNTKAAEILLILISAAFCVFLFFKLWLVPMQITGSSMAPTLCDGETILTDRFYLFDRQMKRGDLLTVRSADGKMFVRRLIGFSGEMIDIVDGIVYINGCPLDESAYIAETDTEVQFLPVTVPEGKVFVLSDDREDVTDSRSGLIGFPGDDEIFGRVLIRLRPWERRALFR